MNISFKKIFKPFLTNTIILLLFLIIIEIFFGYWFDEYNLGPYMREHRMKNQPTILTQDGNSYKYNYKRNYYGFRGEEMEPADIKAIIMGGSVVDERYKPENFTITGYLNENFKEHKNYLKIVNAGIEAQSTIGMIYNFKYWFPRLKNFNPKLILHYVGVNDVSVPPDKLKWNTGGDGHVKNPEKFEIFKDNIRSRSLIYDSLRIFKFKYLPRKNFVKYDGNINPELKSNFNYISYKSAVEKYDIKKLKKKYKEQLKGYLARIDILYNSTKELKSKPIFITNIGRDGYVEGIFIFNYSLMKHCQVMNYDCIDIARKINGKYLYWSSGAHTTKEGSEMIAYLIMKDLPAFLEDIK